MRQPEKGYVLNGIQTSQNLQDKGHEYYIIQSYINVKFFHKKLFHLPITIKSFEVEMMTLRRSSSHVCA